ncbi:MAG TPA: hypothetical protein VGR51_09775 [Thermoplasmata archaeon]|jgi:hypothetical protein|nr:hypothetical protein [Thermoplasmata archaeon]
MPKPKGEKGTDWFDSLDQELQKKTQEILQDVGQQTSKRADLNRALIADAWKIWKRFNAMNVHLSLEPNYDRWAVFPDTFPEGDWRWREGFNATAVPAVTLTDRTQDQGRIGDALKVVHYDTDARPRLRMTFEYCEGEHYYKYSGWKRIWSIHTLLDSSVDRLDMDAVHKVLADVVKVWYESHLRRNRDILIRHLKKNYERVETYNQ